MEFSEIKKISIIDYLSQRGIVGQNKNSKWFCSSPFSRDTNWSFCVYPDNKFVDYSTGKSGDIIDLVQELENCNFIQALDHLKERNYIIIQPNYKQFKSRKSKLSFEYERYLNTNKSEIQRIEDYAYSRGITSGFEYGIFFEKEKDIWTRKPSLMFLHQSEKGEITGAKFRKISWKEGENRFSTRGTLGLYVLENIIEDSFEEPILFLVESETSTNSLWSILKKDNINSVCLSFGGIGQIPRTVPKKYKNLRLKIIIDYDGNEELYQERIKNYVHLKGEFVKLKLNKGEDINSLFCENKTNLITNLIYD